MSPPTRCFSEPAWWHWAGLVCGGVLAAASLAGCADSPADAYCGVVADFYSALYQDEGFGADARKYCLVEGPVESFGDLTSTDARERAANSLFEDFCGEEQLAQPEASGQQAACRELVSLLSPGE